MKKMRFVVELDLNLDVPGLDRVPDDEIMSGVKPYIGQDLDLWLPLIPGMPRELTHLKLVDFEVLKSRD